MKLCPACRKINNDDALKCAGCGYPFDNAPGKTAGDQPQKPAAQPTVQVQGQVQPPSRAGSPDRPAVRQPAADSSPPPVKAWSPFDKPEEQKPSGTQPQKSAEEEARKPSAPAPEPAADRPAEQAAPVQPAPASDMKPASVKAPASPEKAPEKPEGKSPARKVLSAIMSVVMFAGAGAGGYYAYVKYMNRSPEEKIRSAVMGYHGAIMRGDKTAVEQLVSEAGMEEMIKAGDWVALMPMIKAATPPEISVESVKISGSGAEISVKGSGGEMGTVEMVKENGGWKIGKMNWSVKVAP